MNLQKHDDLLKTQKFETIVFALDYIRSMKQVTGEITEDDFVSCLERLYSDSYRHGQRDVMERNINTMFQELDVIEDHFNN